MTELFRVYYANALRLLASERRLARRVDEVYRILQKNHIQAGLADWLGSPFIGTALTILETFQSNYKIKQAIRLLKEAGKEASGGKKRR